MTYIKISKLTLFSFFLSLFWRMLLLRQCPTGTDINQTGRPTRGQRCMVPPSAPPGHLTFVFR